MANFHFRYSYREIITLANKRKHPL